MSNLLPLTFAWVNETQNTFDPTTMARFDEEILSFKIDHQEGQVPTLDMVIKNPRIGLLAPGREVWGWFAWQSPTNDPIYVGALVPLFFGVLVGIPTNLFQEKISIRLLARSPTFIADKQAVAESMKTIPFYDPIWIETSKRDDPDTILEGWSALWHIDRTSLAITASDILEGEDGTLTFTEGQAFYDSVTLKLGQAPLTNIRVEGTVNWTQRSSGFFTVPTVNISSYTGESLLSDWPKPGASIGGGYKCESSFVIDTFYVSQTPTTSYNSSWTNTDPNPGQCSNASASNSSSGPALLAPNPLTAVLTHRFQSGVCFPDSDPPVNTPLTMSSTGVIVPLWNVAMTMEIRYDASRQFSEVLAFDMTANTQSILTSPLVAQNTELLTLSSVDVGAPLYEVDAWTDFAGKAVQLAQIIFPNNPTTPGGLAFQVAVVSGTAGTVEPVFSDVVGQTTTDGGVTWASMGESPLTNAPAWSSAAFVPLGQIINFVNQIFNPNTGQFEDQIGQTSYYLCTGAGQTNSTFTEITYLPPITSNIEPTPAEVHIFNITRPAFSTTPGAQISDGSVTWTVLGTSPALLGIPIGGTPDNVTARCFFPTARGDQSVQYLISRARARLRFRARAVTVGWSCPFNLAVAASCRKDGTLFDPRFPGGAVTGKITGYSLTGGAGKFIGSLEVGCSVGFGGSITEITGTPEYVAVGYVEDCYQVFDGSTFATGNNDTTYSKPIFIPFDDGLQFPLRWQDVSDGGLVSGTLAAQAAAITASFAAAQELAWLNQFGGVISTGNANQTVSGQSPTEAWIATRDQIALVAQNTPYVMNANAISWSCLLKPCAGNGPFGGSYAITVSPLEVPQGINLEAPSSP
jgi:hypothetical protein